MFFQFFLRKNHRMIVLIIGKLAGLKGLIKGVEEMIIKKINYMKVHKIISIQTVDNINKFNQWDLSY